MIQIQNFLALFYGKNAPLDSTLPATLNTTRYVNAHFDSLYMHAQRTSDPADRMLSLALAERQLMKDAVVVPLYHEMSIRVLQPSVMDLPINGMESATWLPYGWMIRSGRSIDTHRVSSYFANNR